MKKILFVALIILQHNFSHAQNYAWTQKANYGGGAIYDPFGFSIGTKGYVGGGRDLSLSYHYDFWEWDQAGNTWTQKANYSGNNVYGARGFSIGNKGYVVSGVGSSGFSKALWEYDPASNSWTQKQSHPGTARYTGVAITIGNKGYFGTGSVYASSYQNDWYEYDPVLNSWTQKASFIGSPRQGASSFVIGTDGYVGMGGDQSLAVDNNDFYKYNSLTNTWTQVASVPGPIRNAAFGFAFGGTGFVTQGYYIAGANDTVFIDFYKYNPLTNSWCQLSNFPGQGHFEGAFFSMGAKAYMGLGSDTYNYSHHMNDFWEVSIVPSDFIFNTIPCQTSVSFITQMPNIINYNWTFGDGGTSTISNPTHNYATAGTYNVQLIVIYPCGSDTINHTVTINAGQIPTAAFTFLTQPCSNSVSFTNQSLNGVNYIWTFGDGATSTLLNPTHNYTNNGTYNVQLIVTSSCGNDTISYAVTVNTNQTVTSVFTFQSQPCSNTISFSNQSSNATFYNWSFGDGTMSSDENPSHLYLTAGTYQVILTAGNSCSTDTLEQAINISANPHADFDFKTSPCDNHVTFSNLSSNATSYFWIFGDNATDTSVNAIHIYNNSGIFPVTLIVQPNTSCADTITREIELTADNHAFIFVPNCFTPNSDSKNDIFKIEGFSPCNEYQIDIYNRWGQIIFHSSKPSFNWDGKYNSKNLPEGVYYYVLTTENYKRYGSITLLR